MPILVRFVYQEEKTAPMSPAPELASLAELSATLDQLHRDILRQKVLSFCFSVCVSLLEALCISIASGPRHSPDAGRSLISLGGKH